MAFAIQTATTTVQLTSELWVHLQVILWQWQMACKNHLKGSHRPLPQTLRTAMKSMWDIIAWTKACKP